MNYVDTLSLSAQSLSIYWSWIKYKFTVWQACSLQTAIFALKITFLREFFKAVNARVLYDSQSSKQFFLALKYIFERYTVTNIPWLCTEMKWIQLGWYIIYDLFFLLRRIFFFLYVKSDQIFKQNSQWQFSANPFNFFFFELFFMTMCVWDFKFF